MCRLACWIRSAFVDSGLLHSILTEGIVGSIPTLIFFAGRSCQGCNEISKSDSEHIADVLQECSHHLWWSSCWYLTINVQSYTLFGYHRILLPVLKSMERPIYGGSMKALPIFADSIFNIKGILCLTIAVIRLLFHARWVFSLNSTWFTSVWGFVVPHRVCRSYKEHPSFAL